MSIVLGHSAKVPLNYIRLLLCFKVYTHTHTLMDLLSIHELQRGQ